MSSTYQPHQVTDHAGNAAVWLINPYLTDCFGDYLEEHISPELKSIIEAGSLKALIQLQCGTDSFISYKDGEAGVLYCFAYDSAERHSEALSAEYAATLPSREAMLKTLAEAITRLSAEFPAVHFALPPDDVNEGVPTIWAFVGEGRMDRDGCKALFQALCKV
ncbi:hypothetical protein HNP46_000357 [Pseudomonas nitritireducens]|uniref:Uncharacterized protein n=1 Tax=Pseudomonas nitroreducens TaxID=46680 RepID=A0A7W7NYK3_PSENT|nr:hypothetical protein [Pseudomonas nitritireducens]MBB4861546.1 hypothetical protein [Pseudomonas nitritireducens]